MSANWVRVYASTVGKDITVTRASAKRRGLKVLDLAAVDRNGRPLPPKARVVAEQATPKPSGKASE